MSIESVMPSSRLILCRPLLLLPPIPPSIMVFSNESTLRMRWPKYWSFSFSMLREWYCLLGLDQPALLVHVTSELDDTRAKLGLCKKHKHQGFPGVSVVKNLPGNAGDAGSIPGSGRLHGEGMATHSSILA